MSTPEDLQFSRTCLLLKSENKFQRKHALEDILKNTFEWKLPIEPPKLLKIWETVHKPVIKILNDQSEACRDTALEILKEFLCLLPPRDKHIVYIIPILSKRLGCQELIEQSEEVRLKCVGLLKIIIPIYKDHLPAYFEDFLTILRRTVTDNYSNVKKESCQCISELAKAVPGYFYSRSTSFANPILGNFAHQHWKVRVASIITIGDVLLYGDSKSMQEVATPLAERLFDQSAAVRAAVVDVAGRWLLELRDRYSWWHKLLPLAMTGLHDEIQETREMAAKLWDKAGLQYMEENESDEKFKNKMDFLTERPEHYPPNINRPNLGCRVIVQQNLCKLIGGIGTELGDWLADIRVRSAQLLCVLVLNAEEHVTQYIEKLLPPMCRACKGEDKRVTENVQLAAEYIGYFVPPDVYCQLVLPSLEENLTTGHLKVFGSILKGSSRKTLSPQLKKIGNFLKQKHICQSRKTTYQKQILFCCTSLLQVCKEDCAIISEDVFQAILTVLSTTTEALIQKEAEELLKTLVEIEKLESLSELFFCHIQVILIDLKNGCESWNVYSPEFHIFRGCILHAKSAITPYLHLVLPILIQTMKQTADTEVRLKQFILLSEYFESHRDESLNYGSEKDFTDFIDSLLEKIVIPGLIWSAGRTAEAIRTASVCCLCTLLRRILYDFNVRFELRSENKKEALTNKPVKLFTMNQRFSELFNQIISILVSLMDDNSKKIRLYSLEAVSLVTNIGKLLNLTTDAHIHRVYPVVLKRLDDGCNDVRCTAVDAIKEVWKALPENYDLDFSRSHVDVLYTTAIIHLDDPERKFQELMLDALMDLSQVHPKLLIKKIESCRGNFRNQEGLSSLLNYIHEYLSGNQKVDKFVTC
ncbi:dynein assembly factor 5, axonemal [Belonocnema kinseyi]|uniref:dynein assembly factor 5, axonemal n=1 Tax=Belonocnema kinseyi TaxID=2817044 RepID=UPI00143DCE09|nr:dynein assembly factor 5, axonemal [Belonocnema kinseyi]XP_033213241.1 dynein assembly factor 5, axonemal [Belonocnema kinseyi]XP_033213242.1 dynein assembly factor 5, axonemal [Belonocnema kinseyi]